MINFSGMIYSSSPSSRLSGSMRIIYKEMTLCRFKKDWRDRKIQVLTEMIKAWTPMPEYLTVSRKTDHFLTNKYKMKMTRSRSKFPGNNSCTNTKARMKTNKGRTIGKGNLTLLTGTQTLSKTLFFTPDKITF